LDLIAGDIVKVNYTKGGIQKSIVRRRSMVSEIDLLREDIPRLEKKFGTGNLFVEVLKAQLALLQNQRKQQLQRFRHHRRLVNFKRFQIRKRNESSDNQL
jgi:dynactin complex subunit